VDETFPYEILEELGRGSMGVVYRARQRGLEREVALKMVALEPGTAASPEYLLRFEREALALAKLSHGHLVKVLDAGRHQGQPYIAMELLRGRSLESLGLEDPVSMRRRADELFLQLVAAVAELHRHGLVHRDLKPANLMIDDAGRIVVMDLGLVKDASGDGVRLTDTGTLVGTPLYLAPEVFGGAFADERADVWSLGCVWFFLHAGRPPFAGESFPELIRAITHGPLPELARELPDMPADRREVLARLLVRAPAGRPRDAGRVLALLEGRSGSGVRSRSGRTSGTSGRSVPPSRPRRMRALAVGGALAASAVVGGVVAWLGAPPSAPRPSPALTVAPATPSPSGATSVLAKIRGLHGFAPRLRAGGPTAENACKDLRTRTGMSLGRETWAFWFELDRWMAELRAGSAPPEPGRAWLDMQVATELGFSIIEDALRGHTDIRSPVCLVLVVDVLSRHPADARGWLLLGRIYQLEGFPEEARRLYRAGLARRSTTLGERWSRHSFQSLIHAHLETGADLVEGWRAWVEDHQDAMGVPGGAWEALRQTLEDIDPELCERVLRAGIGSPFPEQPGLELHLLYRHQGRPRAECSAVLEKVLARRREGITLQRRLSDHLSIGDVESARPLAREIGDVRTLELILAPPGVLPAPPPERFTLHTIALTWSHLLAERGDVAALAGTVDDGPAGLTRALGDWGRIVTGLVLLSFDVEQTDLEARCDEYLTKGPRLWVELYSLLSSVLWPARSAAGFRRQQALLERLVAKHPHVAELPLAQALLSSRQGRHDEALDLLERAFAHRDVSRVRRAAALEVLVRAVLLAPGTPAARRAARFGLPPAPRPSHYSKLVDTFWERAVRGDRAGAGEAAQKVWLERDDLTAALTPLWVNPKSWPARAAWIARLRTAWRYSYKHPLVPLE
jgi:predicted Ser/Thr protein kinase